MSRLTKIADFIAGTPPEGIPAPAIEAARTALVDFVASAAAGTQEPVSKIVVRHIGEATGAGSATVIGHGRRALPADAAFANGTIAHALDYDDSSMILGGHPSVALFPAALAVGQSAGKSAREVLEAYVIGFEVMTAIARTVNFAHYEKGWHPTATIGLFGATATAVRLLDLSPEQSAAALGLAASMASGIKANVGSMAKPLQVGEASRRGVACALLAADGCTASPDALEGKQGFFQVYNGPGLYRPEELDRLGDGFEILRTGILFKKYACCGSTHAPIDAAIAIRQKHNLAPRDIAEIVVKLNARRRPHVDRPHVTDALAAKFSVQHTVAAALTDGEVRLRHFSDEAIREPGIQRLTRLVKVVDLPGGDRALAQSCEVLLRTTDGKEVALRLEDAEGRNAEGYLGYMKEKFLDCTAHLLGASAAERLLEALLSCDDGAAIDDLIGCLAGNENDQTIRAVQ